jgi:2-phospho-L-lactate/phosphoenolpyruvate guanylyltransferase
MHPATTDADLLPSIPTGIVIPIRAFTDGMARLSSVLSPNQRADLGRDLAGRVIDAASNFASVVVTSAPEVIEWCELIGHPWIPDPGSLNASADSGSEWCISQGLERVIIAHADLPGATKDAFEEVARCGAAKNQRNACVIVACHRNDGTPVIGIPVDAEFNFAYGPGSFELHLKEARSCGLEIQVLSITELAYDIDMPEDLSALGYLGSPTIDRDESEETP